MRHPLPSGQTAQISRHGRAPRLPPPMEGIPHPVSPDQAHPSADLQPPALPMCRYDWVCRKGMTSEPKHPSVTSPNLKAQCFNDVLAGPVHLQSTYANFQIDDGPVFPSNQAIGSSWLPSGGARGGAGDKSRAFEKTGWMAGGRNSVRRKSGVAR